MKFQTPIGVLSNNKIISLTNKQLSFLIQKYIHFLGHKYATDLKTTYNKIVTESNNEVIVIEEPAFQFFDYESVNGTGHSYDLMFFLLYCYKVNNLKAKMLVVESDNKYYNSLLELIKKYFKIEYLFIKPNQTYLFKTFMCTRSYQNILFNEVKEFINLNLIDKIIKKYEECNSTFYKNIIKIKYENTNVINRLNTGFVKTEHLSKFLNNNKMFDLSDIDDNEELKIYLINKATNIVINWGYYININYYLLDSKEKFISVIFHTNIMAERVMIKNINDKTFKQDMPGEFCANLNDQFYNKFEFVGEVIDNITNIDDFISETKL